jgi:hypothetical protein
VSAYGKGLAPGAMVVVRPTKGGAALSAFSSLRATGRDRVGEPMTDRASITPPLQAPTASWRKRSAVSNFDQEGKMNEAPKLNALIPELYCTSIKASISFYTKILGFEILYQREEATLPTRGSDIRHAGAARRPGHA